MKSIIKTTLTIALAVVIAAHSAHAAWTLPTTTPPGGNVAAPLNTGTTSQVKQSSLGILGYLSAYNGFFGPVPSSASYVSSRIFSAMTDHRTGKGLFVSAAGEPVVQNTSLIVDLRANSGGLGRNAVDIQASPDNINAVFTTNMPGFHFWSNASSSSAKILAGAITLRNGCSGGTCNGKILTSDADGNASWGAIQGTGGQIDGLIRITPTVSSTAGIISASCDSDEVLVGGGGQCDYGLKASFPSSATAWSVQCLNKLNPPLGGGGFASGTGSGSSGTGYAQAICMKKIGFLQNLSIGGTMIGTTSGTSGGSGTGGTTPATIAWHPVTDKVPGITNGSSGQSCQSWLVANNAGTYPVRSYQAAYGNSNGDINDTCAYKSSSPIYASNAQNPVVSSTIPAWGGGIAQTYWKTTCFVGKKSQGYANAVPTASCSDSSATIYLVSQGSQNGTTTGQTFTAQVESQIQY